MPACFNRRTLCPYKQWCPTFPDLGREMKVSNHLTFLVLALLQVLMSITCSSPISTYHSTFVQHIVESINYLTLEVTFLKVPFSSSADVPTLSNVFFKKHKFKVQHWFSCKIFVNIFLPYFSIRNMQETQFTLSYGLWVMVFHGTVKLTKKISAFIQYI